MSDATSSLETAPAGTARPSLALFDVDGTLTTRDSLLLFLLSTHGRVRVGAELAALAPRIAKCWLQGGSRGQAKERLLARFYAAWPREKLESAGENLAAALVEQYLRPGAWETVARHREQGRVILVSASPETWIAPLARRLEAECLATPLAYVDGLFTGHFAAPNCHGQEKVRRIREYVPDLERYAVTAYGDSKGDLPMLAVADQAFYKPFRDSKRAGRSQG